MPFTGKTGEEEFDGGEVMNDDFGVTGDNNEEQEMVEVDGFFLMPGEGVVVMVEDWVFGTDTTDFTGVFVTHLGMSSIFFTFSTGLLLLSILFLTYCCVVIVLCSCLMCASTSTRSRKMIFLQPGTRHSWYTSVPLLTCWWCGP